MSVPPIDSSSFEDHAAPPPELDVLAECLRREASELSALYPPRRAEQATLDCLRSAGPPRRKLAWSAGAAAAVLLVCVGTWTVARQFPLSRAVVDERPYAVPAMGARMDNSQQPLHSWSQPGVPEVIPVLPLNRVGVHDMNGPEIEAVLNLLEDNRTSLKLAL